ncbi:alpha/beta fold hydrolase [Halosimplex sp. TS25]|uniref:S9 family peptidase n=1 Tax=Halosimplex rarum TaxID=3396619 RepID=UPI0039E9F442
MADPSIETLTARPGLSRSTLVPERGALAQWYSEPGGEKRLRLYEYDTGETEQVPVESDALDPPDVVRTFWTGSEFLLQSRPEVYRLPIGGDPEPLELQAEYTLVNDIDGDSRRLLYVHYAEPWTLRLRDRETDTDWALSEHPEQEGFAGFSPDDEWVAYRENPSESLGEGRQVVATTDGKVEAAFHVGDPESRTRQRGWHPDGRRILLDDRSTGWYRTGLHDWRTDETTWFGTGERDELPAALSPDGETLVTIRRADGRCSAVRYPVDAPDEGQVLDLPGGEFDTRSATAVDLPNAGNEVLLRIGTATRPQRLFAYDLDAGEARVLEDTTTEALEAAPLVEPEYVTYESTDGFDIDAVLYRTESDRPGPAVVYVHGGPTTAERCDYDPFAQFLVGLGYSVLKPNYRGSTNRDRAFEAAIRGDSGYGDVDDVAEGGRWLADRSWVDGDRLAVVGHSYGAYNAAMQAIRYPDLWSAAVVENGTLDRVEVLGDPNQYALRRVIDDPAEETTEAYLREISPVHRTDDVGTFVCVVHGAEGPGLEMAERFVEGFRERGWSKGEEFRFEVIEGEGHVIGDVEPYWRLVADVLDERM